MTDSTTLRDCTTSSRVARGQYLAKTSISVVRRASAKNIAALIEGRTTYKWRRAISKLPREAIYWRANPQGITLGAGRTYSPSIAAVRCYAQIGSTRPTENGRRVWKNKDRLTLNSLFDKFQAQMGSMRTKAIYSEQIVVLAVLSTSRLGISRRFAPPRDAVFSHHPRPKIANYVTFITVSVCLAS